MKTSHNIFELAHRGINVVPYEYFVDESQLMDSTVYKIGILNRKNTLTHGKICLTREEQLMHIAELYRNAGEDIDIIIMEHTEGDSYCVFSLTKDTIEIAPNDLPEEHIKTLNKWAEILREDFDFRQDLAGVVILDEQGELALKSIN